MVYLAGVYGRGGGCGAEIIGRIDSRSQTKRIAASDSEGRSPTRTSSRGVRRCSGCFQVEVRVVWLGAARSWAWHLPGASLRPRGAGVTVAVEVNGPTCRRLTGDRDSDGRLAAGGGPGRGPPPDPGGSAIWSNHRRRSHG
jgi:hypothetical protein